MRLSIIISAALFSMLANIANAAPIVVRSGAHDGFSRLVLNVLPETEWSVENNGTSARIMIPGHEDGFNLKSVFDRIDQTHVAKLDSGTGWLDIHFSCNCALSAFNQGDRMIVLDVSPSSEPQIPPESLVNQFQTGLAPTQALQFGSTVAPTSKPASNALPAIGNISNPMIPDVSSDDSPGNMAETIDATAISMAKAQQNISMHVGAAATRGLLTPKKSQFDLPLIQNRPQIDVEIFDSSTFVTTLVENNVALDGGNLRITSSSDLPRDAGSFTESTTFGIRCIDPSVTAIGDWASDEPFSRQIAERRNKLFSEFDRLDQGAAVALARTYLYFGFGIEAREVLALHPQLTQDNPALLEIAEIMEFGYAKRPEYLQNFTECDNDIALWSILSKRTIEPAKSINTSAALRAVTALPMHLRSFIAPELSRRLLDYGDPDAAAAALRSLERATKTLPSSADLAKADLEMAQGNVSDAQDRLARVVSSNVEQSAEALIKFVNSHLQADGQIEQEVATLVEAYAIQMRDDPIGAELERTHVLALGKSSQFNAAFDALDRIRDRGGDETDSYVTESLLNILTKNGSDIEFLDHTFHHIPSLGRAVDAKTITNIADRLVDLGFALDAERILAERSDMPNDPPTRLVRAKVALSLSRPFEAEALIFGLNSADANALRAEAKAQSGAFDEAHTLFSQLGQEDGRQRTAWLSDDWVSLIEHNTPVLGDVARVAQTEISDDTNPEGMLLRTSDAISESAQARSVIEELLRVSSQDSTIDP